MDKAGISRLCYSDSICPGFAHEDGGGMSLGPLILERRFPVDACPPRALQAMIDVRYPRACVRSHQYQRRRKRTQPESDVWCTVSTTNRAFVHARACGRDSTSDWFDHHSR